jgi:hypothetical protein
MNPIRVSVTVAGTDAESIERTFSGTTTFYAQQATDNTILLTTTPSQMTRSSVNAPLFAYIENLSTVDVAYAVQQTGGSSVTEVSLVVPPGACTIVNLSMIEKGTSGVLSMWTQRDTGYVRLITFY